MLTDDFELLFSGIEKDLPRLASLFMERISLFMAFPAGFEPTAFRLGGGRSILLSYGNMSRRIL